VLVSRCICFNTKDRAHTEVSDVMCLTISYPAELIALELREFTKFDHCQSVHIREVHILATSNFLYGSMRLCR